jgi:lysozyme
VLDEGFRSKVYKDSIGLATIGYGFNLADKSNRAVLKKHLGNKYDFDKLRRGWQSISRVDAETLLRGIVNDMVKKLRNQVFPHSWNKFNSETQNVLTNMAYQLGIPRLKKFKKMIKGLRNEDYQTAAKEMLDSRWARSNSPSRAQRLYQRMKKANNVK